MDVGSLLAGFSSNWAQHILVICCTLIMFILQRRRARRIFRLHRETVVIFSRYPEPGLTKTRLKPALGDHGAARAQLLMTEHLLNQLTEHQKDHRDLTVEVSYSGGTDTKMAAWLGRRSENCQGELTWHRQKGENLGDRMKNAIIRHISKGEDRVVIVGSDIPSITGNDLEEAMNHLRQEDNCDIVLGEALDGGYYLIGLNTSGAAHVHELFEGIPWGTNKVYKLQFSKALKLKLKLRVLSRRYNDVDTPEDIPMMIQQLSLTREDLFFPQWSVIIPTLNEGNSILQILDTVTKRCSCKEKIEILVIDGGSTDDTKQNVLHFNKVSDVKVKLVESQKGRGIQCRAGANLAKGFYLIFLHADTLLPDNFDNKAEELLCTPGTVAGAFPFGMDALHFDEKRQKHTQIFLWKLRIIEAAANWRAHYRELPYGDQALFMTRQMYHRVDGFPPWPLMEDYHLVEKLQTQGFVRIVPGEPAITSAKRWERHGAIKITATNLALVVAYKFFKVSPERLAVWYYGKEKKE